MAGRKTRLVWLIAAAIGVGSLAAGCGQKGPLYLSDEEKLDKLEEKKQELEEKK